MAVPGRALGAVIAGLKSGLPPPAHAALAAFHADVVTALRAASGGGGDAAALQARLLALCLKSSWGDRIAESC